MKHPFLLVFVLLTLAGSSQSITGTVQSDGGTLLAQATISLLKAKDSSRVRSTNTDSVGHFTLVDILPGRYLLSATSVGFQPTFTPVAVAAGSPQATGLVLTLPALTGQLKEVTVTGRRPLMEQKLDRTVVNVANSIIASGSTALDVLEKAPGITVDRQNDQVSLRGKEGVVVQIDGKQTFLPMADVVALLRSLPGDNIDRIEIITHPSAKYDAAGNAGIIDIRLKKNNNTGTNGAVSLSGGTGRYGRQRGNLQVNHRSLKYNHFINYSAYRGGTYWDFDISRHQSQGADQNFIKSLSFIRMRDNGQNVKAGVDYFVSQRTTIGVVWTAFWNTFTERSPAHLFFRRQEGGDPYLHTLSDKRITTQSSNQLGNVNLQHAFKKNKAQFSADFDLARFRRDYTNALATQTLLPVSPPEPVTGLYTQMPTAIDIVTAKADYSQALSADWKLEAGVKSSSVHSDNNVELQSGENGHLQRDTGLSNHFRYTETINAAYLNFSGKLGERNNVMLGLRAEHTRSVGNSLSLNRVVNRRYLNLFPSLFFSRGLGKENTLTLSYSYRIDRPNYQNLNPARSYLDPYTYSSGNESLQPQYTHSLELRHGFRDRVFTSVGASYITDLQFHLIQPLDEKTTRRMPENIGRSQAYNLTLSFPVKLSKGWNLQGTVLGYYSVFDYTYKGTPVSVQQFAGRLNLSNALVFGKGWTGEWGGWLNSPSLRAVQKTPWLGSLDAGVQKVLNTRWKTKLSVQDVLHTNQIRFTIDAPGFTSRGSIVIDTRVVLLNVTYSFGNQQLKGSRQRKTAAEEEVQRTN